jgi:predicted ATPase
VSARDLLQQFCRIDPGYGRILYGASHYPTDPYAWALGYLGLTLTCLGQLDQGRAKIKRALREARQLGRAHTMVEVLDIACQLGVVASLPEEVQSHSQEYLTLASDHGFPHWVGLGLVCRAWSFTVLGQAQDALSLVTQGLSILRSTGSLFTPLGTDIMIAEIKAKLGQPGEALGSLNEAERNIQITDQRYGEAELYRLWGEFLNSTGDQVTAQKKYEQALATAKCQDAKLFEIRAATGLARLWRDQGKRTEARDLLAPIYSWFTEGFDTPVLQDAKALLDQLT